MRKFLYRAAIFISLSLSFFLNPLAVNHVEADYLKITAPAEVAQNSQFELALEISAKPNTTYSVKVRLGSGEGQLNKGQTLDSQTGVWLSDSVSWERFPQFQTDADGGWSGKLKAKPNTAAALGQNLLVVRIRNSNDNSSKDSEPYQISINEPPKVPEAPKTESQGEPILNEFLPSPNGGQEWVEIKNKGAGNIDLSGWFIDDEEGKSSPFVVPQGTIVVPNSFYVAYFSSAKLNDLTDSVRLLRPDNSIVEEYRYNSPEKGKSFAKASNGSWFITDSPTPGTKNADPPSVSQPISNQNSGPKVLTAATTDEATTALSASAPKLSGSTSARIATVSASYKDNQEKTGLLSKLPFIFGSLLIVVALGIVGKNVYLKYKSNKFITAGETEG